MRINAAQQHDDTKPRNKSKNARSKESLPKSEINSHNLPPVDKIDNIPLIAPDRPKNLFPSSRYTKSIASGVLNDIAYTNVPIDDICHKYNISTSMWYRWVGNIDALRELLAQARTSRARLQFDAGIDRFQSEMDEYLQSDAEWTEKKAMLQGYRIKQQLLQWRIERGNPREFGTKVEIDSRIAVDAGHEREQAWLARKRSMRDADCEIVDTDVDTGKQEHNNINELGRDTRD